MAEGTELSFEEFMGELRELRGRVVATHIRDDEGTVIAFAEGELGNLTRESGATVSFQLGGVPPVEREGVRFIASSFVVVTVSNFTRAERFGPDEGYVGAPVIHTYTAAGPRIEFWPAMPPREQYTEMHDDNR